MINAPAEIVGEKGTNKNPNRSTKKNSTTACLMLDFKTARGGIHVGGGRIGGGKAMT